MTGWSLGTPGRKPDQSTWFLFTFMEEWSQMSVEKAIAGLMQVQCTLCRTISPFQAMETIPATPWDCGQQSLQRVLISHTVSCRKHSRAPKNLTPAFSDMYSFQLHVAIKFCLPWERLSLLFIDLVGQWQACTWSLAHYWECNYM